MKKRTLLFFLGAMLASTLVSAEPMSAEPKFLYPIGSKGYNDCSMLGDLPGLPGRRSPADATKEELSAFFEEERRRQTKRHAESRLRLLDYYNTWCIDPED